MIWIKLLSDYALLKQLPSRDNEQNQPGMEWANPQAALIPPDGGQGKKFPGCGFWSCISGGGLLCFVKNRGWYKVPGGLKNKSHFKNGKLQACVK